MVLQGKSIATFLYPLPVYYNRCLSPHSYYRWNMSSSSSAQPPLQLAPSQKTGAATNGAREHQRRDHPRNDDLDQPPILPGSTSTHQLTRGQHPTSHHMGSIDRSFQERVGETAADHPANVQTVPGPEGSTRPHGYRNQLWGGSSATRGLTWSVIVTCRPSSLSTSPPVIQQC